MPAMNSSPNASVELAPTLDPSALRWEGHVSNGFGATTGSDLASLTATATELVLSGTIGTYHVPRAAVTKLGRGNMYPWFFAGIRIHHRQAKCPEELQFKPVGEASSRDLLVQLQALGYPAA